MRNLLLMVMLSMSTAVMADTDNTGLFQGTADGSEANLTQLCKTYMQEGFIHNDVTLYLKLLPPEAAEYEAQIRKGIDSTYKKTFKGLAEPSYQLFELGPVELGEYKGKPTQSVKLRYQAKGVKDTRSSRCFFEQNSDGRWYLGQHP
jgi:hypothetical protein